MASKQAKKFGWSVLILALVGLGVLGLVRGVRAQTTTPSDDEVNAVARQMYCPVCENIPLDVCPTQACAQWRDLIRLKLSQGWTSTQIKDYFVAQYGDRVLSTPPRHGINWLVYILPPIFILGAAALVWRTLLVLRRKRKLVEVEPSAPADAADPYIRRMEEELRRKRD